jgi:hypothetical protein
MEQLLDRLPCIAVFEHAALQELPQHSLDHRAQRPMLSGEAPRPSPQQLLEVLLDQAKERRLARTPRRSNPAGHARGESHALSQWPC